jgi:hypothetical protein
MLPFGSCFFVIKIGRARNERRHDGDHLSPLSAALNTIAVIGIE